MAKFIELMALVFAFGERLRSAEPEWSIVRAMPRTSEFCEHIVDLLTPLGQASYKFMFGGYGVYVDGLMIAIVADDRLLLRADDENRPDFEALGIGPFQPFEGKGHSMPFFTVPDEVMDDSDELVEWARKALAATQRMQAKKGGKARRQRPTGRP